MKKLLAVLLFALALCGSAWAAGDTAALPIIDPNLAGAIKGTSNAYFTVTTDFKSTAAGQLLIGTTNNLVRTVWMADRANSTNNWHKIVP